MGGRGDGGSEGGLPARRPKVRELEADGGAQKERTMVAATPEGELIGQVDHFLARSSNNMHNLGRSVPKNLKQSELWRFCAQNW